MQITDEVKTFLGEDGVTLEVSSNQYGTHNFPSAFLYADDGAGLSVGFGTSDTERIKEIIEHMAKMAGLVVTITDATEPVDFPPQPQPQPQPGGFTPKFQKGDRVRSLMPDEDSALGTVLHDEPHVSGWNVRVMLDGQTIPGLYVHDELKPVSGE